MIALSTYVKFGIILLGAALFSACGTLDIDVEPEAPDVAGLSTTPSPLGNARPADNLRMTPTNTPVFQSVIVAFFKDSDVWLWRSDGGDATPLTSFGDVNQSNIKLSDDGRFVAFTRSLELWLARTDGSEAHRLLGAGELDYLDPDGPGVFIYRYDWVPGKAFLAFNTRQKTNRGTVRYNDLHLINAETSERSELLPDGQGGDFIYSPDGRQIALVRPGIISLVDADGGNRQEGVLTYTPAETYAEEQYYAQPVWSADGRELLVPILPADPLAQPAQQTTIWRVPAGGSPAELVANLRADPLGRFILAPDQGLVAYFGSEDDAGERALLVTELASGETSLYAEDVFNIISGWSPATSRFAYLLNPQEGVEAFPQAQLAQPGRLPVAIDVTAGSSDQILVGEVRWLDDYRFLALARPVAAAEWLILLDHVSGPIQEVATISDIPGGDVPSYDFSLGN